MIFISYLVKYNHIKGKKNTFLNNNFLNIYLYVKI
jgi:hypothetical protein